MALSQTSKLLIKKTSILNNNMALQKLQEITLLRNLRLNPFSHSRTSEVSIKAVQLQQMHKELGCESKLNKCQAHQRYSRNYCLSC